MNLWSLKEYKETKFIGEQGVSGPHRPQWQNLAPFLETRNKRKIECVVGSGWTRLKKIKNGTIHQEGHGQGHLDRKGVLLIDSFWSRSENDDCRYFDMLIKLKPLRQKTKNTVERGCCHSRMQVPIRMSFEHLINGSGWKRFSHPPYSPDIAPSHFHAFLGLKDDLARKVVSGQT